MLDAKIAIANVWWLLAVNDAAFARVAAQAHQCRKRERLCRYIARPAVSTERMVLTNQGNIRYTLKTPYRDGTTHIVLDPLDFMARLAALVPKPRVNLTRFHGVFAPNSVLRKQIALKARCKRSAESETRSPAQQYAAMTGFCSCKTGIPTIHGHNMGSTVEASIHQQ